LKRPARCLVSLAEEILGVEKDLCIVERHPVYLNLVLEFQVGKLFRLAMS
jgi:hypothetical protein